MYPHLWRIVLNYRIVRCRWPAIYSQLLTLTSNMW